MSKAPAGIPGAHPGVLTTKDSIAVVAPAGPASSEQLTPGLEYLRSRFQIETHGDLMGRHGYFSGDNPSRVRALQDALASKTARAVIATRGGFGTSKLIDQIDLSPLEDHPKWIIGSSDLTCLHVKLWAERATLSIHGPMVVGLGQQEQDDRLLEQILTRGSWTPPPKLLPCQEGTAEGPFVGGNLTMLAHLAGTLDPSFLDDSILFLEDIGERPYRLERALVQLERAGFLSNLAGVVLGEFTDCLTGKDGTTVEAALMRNLGPLKIPIASGYPAAHGERNHPFIHGSHVQLDIREDEVSFSTCPP